MRPLRPVMCIILLFLTFMPIVSASADCLWQSTDWANLRAVDPTNSRVIYAFNPIESCPGLCKSVDAGNFWSRIGSGLGDSEVGLTIDRRDSRILYAGTDSGLYKSINGGSSWRVLSPEFSGSWVSSPGIAPSDSNVLYVYTSRGLHRSDNQGRTWVLVIENRPAYGWSGYGLVALDPVDSRVFYTSYSVMGSQHPTVTTIDKWTFDGTASSETILSGTSVGSNLFIDPSNAQILYNYFGEVVRKSIDGGQSWSEYEVRRDDGGDVIPTVITALVINPRDGQVLFAATRRDGILVSVDGGLSWSTCNQGESLMEVGRIFLDEASGQLAYSTPFIAFGRYIAHRNLNNVATVMPPGEISIPPSDHDGNFPVRWADSATAGAHYVLEEATDPEFTENLRTVYSGRATRASIKQRLAGHSYYYRVKATMEGYADSAWVSGAHGCEIPHVVVTYKNSGGSLSPIGRVIIPVGTEQTFTIAPDPGYHTVSVLVDGNELGAVTSVSVPAQLVPNARNKHTLKVKFAPNSYQVTSMSGEGGRISPAGVKIYRHGKQVTYTIKPDRGYRIASVLVNGVEQTGLPASGLYRLRLTVTAAIQVSATFAQEDTSGNPNTGSFTWRWRNPLPTGNSLASAAYGGGIYVAVGYEGAIITSLDGHSWSAIASGTMRNLYSITHGNGLFAAVGSHGTLLTSQGGSLWANRNSGTTAELRQITYGDGRFVAVGENIVVTSTDGINWTATAVPQNFVSVTYGNNLFVAVLLIPYGSSGDVATSTDGLVWTIQTSGVNPDKPVNEVTYGNGLFVALGSGSILTSSDAITWVRRFEDDRYWLNSAAYGNGRYIAVEDTGQILASVDGTVWTVQPSVTDRKLIRVAFGNGLFLSVGDLGTILTSTDAIAWTECSSNQTLAMLIDVAYGGGQFVAVGSGGTIVTSPDGVSWFARQSGTDRDLTGIAYGNGKYVAVGSGATVLTSYDCETWTSSNPLPLAVDPTGVTLDDVSFGNGVFVISGFSTHYCSFTSTDGGVTWSSGLSGIHAVAFTGGIFLALQTTSTFSPIPGEVYYEVAYHNEIVTSPDAMRWESLSTPNLAYTISAMAYGNDRYVGIEPVYDGPVATSVDGIIWNEYATGVAEGLRDIAFGRGYFVVVGTRGTTIVSTDGTEWVKVSQVVPSGYDLNAVTYGNGTFVAVGPNGSILQSSTY